MKKDRVLQKPVQAIHCSGNVSLIGHKMFNIMLWQALKTDKELGPEKYKISEDLLLKYTNISKNNADYLRKLVNQVKELMQTVVEWNLQEDGKKVWGCSALLGSLKYIDQGVIEYSFPIHLRELIVQNNIFGVIHLGVARKFKSKYSIALYELCCRYKNVGTTGYIQIEKLREMFGVVGYKEYRDFKKRVLDKSITEINKFSDLNVEAVPKKKGKKIDRIKFIINKNSGIEYFVPDTNNESTPQQTMTDEQVERNKQKLKEIRSKLHGKEKEEK
jgi:plasmid replication initiation protein